MERGTHTKEVLLRELINLSECGQHPNIVQLRVRRRCVASAAWPPTQQQRSYSRPHRVDALEVALPVAGVVQTQTNTCKAVPAGGVFDAASPGHCHGVRGGRRLGAVRPGASTARGAPYEWSVSEALLRVHASACASWLCMLGSDASTLTRPVMSVVTCRSSQGSCPGCPLVASRGSDRLGGSETMSWLTRLDISAEECCVLLACDEHADASTRTARAGGCPRGWRAVAVPADPGGRRLLPPSRHRAQGHQGAGLGNMCATWSVRIGTRCECVLLLPQRRAQPCCPWSLVKRLVLGANLEGTVCPEAACIGIICYAKASHEHAFNMNARKPSC